MKHWKNFDSQLLVLPALLVAFSCILLYEISRWDASVPSATPVKQFTYALLGLILLWILTNVDYKLIGRLIWPAYLAVLGALAFVAVAGHGTYGAARVINLGFIELQPSEPAKLIVVIALARFLSNRESRMGELSTIAGSLLITALPAVLVLREPDFGSTMIFVAIWVAVMVMASIPIRYMIGMAALTVIATPIVWLKVLRGFQRLRLTAFLSPDSYLRGANYGPFHAQLAVGSGGIWGQWFSRSTQSRLNFLVFQDKDYIFSVIAEQIGFVGTVAMFLVYIALLFRVARVAFISADSFGRLIAGGVLTMFLFQTFIHIGANIGIMPATGIPLPFISYGGSSLITSLAALGILESILLRHQKLIFNTGQSIL